MDRKTYFGPLFIIAFALATAGFLNGAFLPEPLVRKVFAFMKEYLGNIRFGFWGVFANNLLAATVLFLGGFLLVLPSLPSYYFNFLALGATFQLTRVTPGVKIYLVSILPHGVFEIAAIVTAFVLGCSLAITIVRKLVLKKDVRFLEALRKLVFLFLVIVVPLLVIAAFVEVNVTIRLIQQMKHQ